MDNKMEQIKMLNLTEQDFQLLVDGLDALPEKGMAGDFLGDMLTSMFTKDDPEAKEKAMKERQAERAKKEAAKNEMKENIKILQGKLLMLKRHFQENNILSQAYEVLEIPRH
jgi:hypothetical protein